MGIHWILSFTGNLYVVKDLIGSRDGESSIVSSANHHDDRVFFLMGETRAAECHGLLGLAMWLHHMIRTHSIILYHIRSPPTDFRLFRFEDYNCSHGLEHVACMN